MKNQVIKNLNPEMGKEIIKYWKSKGVNTHDYSGERNEQSGFSGVYYGVINGVFSYYELEDVEYANAEIIELPKLPQKVIATTVIGYEYETYLVAEVNIGKVKSKYIVVAERTIDAFENDEEYVLQAATNVRIISEKEKKIKEIKAKIEALRAELDELKKIISHE